jgi:hypothetical protein
VVKVIKNLDVQDIQQQVDSTKKFINKTKEGVEQVKQAINGITTLNDGFKGETADSIRSFYEEAHKPFLEFMESFLVQYEEALSTVTEEVRSFESSEQGFIREEFLKDDLKAKLVKASTSLTSTTIAINQQLLHVRDIANVSSVKSDPFIEAIDKGKEKLSDTLSNMYDMDASATSKLDKPEDDIQQMKTYLTKLRNAIDKNNISVDSFNITQFKGEFFEYHDEFKLLAKGRNALATGDKAEITEQDFNELYPYKKDEIYVSDGHYEWHGRYYTLEDGRIVREYKHDTGGVSYEFVDEIPDPRAAPDNWFSKALKWTWDFFTEDIATIFDPEASAGEKIFALAMFLPIGKPVKGINKVGGGFISDGVKYLEDLVISHKGSKVSLDTKPGVMESGTIRSNKNVNKGNNTSKLEKENIKDYGKYSTNIDDKVNVTEQAELPSWIAESFTDGNYRTVVTQEKITFYRTYGGSAKETGAFVTTTPAGNRINAKLSTALVPDWKNSRQFEAVIEVPKGETLNIGRVEKQYTKSGALLEGDGDQILLPQGWSSDWIKETRKVPSR